MPGKIFFFQLFQLHLSFQFDFLLNHCILFFNGTVGFKSQNKQPKNIRFIQVTFRGIQYAD